MSASLKPEQPVAVPFPARGEPAPISEQSLFDEEYYRTRHPDIAKAIAEGRVSSGWEHYERSGRKENRDARIGDFEPGFYNQSYPVAREEIRNGQAKDMRDHYEQIGKHRAYLPNPRAARPDRPGAAVSRFGGLWPDMPNAGDLIAGKLELGLITAAQAELMRAWRRDGYVILPSALGGERLEEACAALERAYSGQVERQMFESAEVFGYRTPKPWRQEVNHAPAKALDVHFLSAAIRDAIFAPAITDFLELVFESRAMASQSLGFYRGSAQEGHQDTAYVAYTMPRNFVASWIALEDVTPGAGELFYYPGSHKLDDFLYGGGYKTIHDCKRMNDGVFPHGEAIAFLESLKSRAAAEGLPKQTFAAKKGDVLMWHADLIHGGSPVSQGATRKSIVTHYCSNFLVPLYFEERPSNVYAHGKQSFSTSAYAFSEPGT